MSDADADADEVAEVAEVAWLLKQSSLGTPGANELKQRTSPHAARLLALVAQERNRIMHGAPPSSLAVGQALEDLHAFDEAGSFYLWLAAEALQRLAAISDNQGQPEKASTWRRRAETLR